MSSDMWNNLYPWVQDGARLQDAPAPSSPEEDEAIRLIKRAVSFYEMRIEDALMKVSTQIASMPPSGEITFPVERLREAMTEIRDILIRRD